MKNDILLNMEAQKVTLLVLLDLSAAFDTVQHDTLLNRLKSRFGVDGKALKWFASYLADRTQRVTMNDGLSSAFPLRQGVPQGSCLEPLLFTVYTSKLFNIVSKHLPSVHCFADDTQLYLARHLVLLCKGRTRPWLPVRQCISFKILLFFFKAIHGIAPTYLRELVSIKRPGNYKLRSSLDGLLLAMPTYRSRVTLGDISFQVTARALWNASVPHEIRSITDLEIFLSAT